MTKVKTSNYIVTRSGVCVDKDPSKLCKIGDEIKLTEAKAAALVGKVRLASEKEVPEVADLLKKIKLLEKQNAELSEALTAATAPPKTGK